MVDFFILAFLVALGLLGFGLISPTWLKPLLRGIWTRARIAAVFGGAVIFSFIGVGLTAPPVEHLPAADAAVIESQTVEEHSDVAADEFDANDVEDEVENDFVADASSDDSDDNDEENTTVIAPVVDDEPEEKAGTTVVVPATSTTSTLTPTTTTSTSATSSTTNTTSGTNTYTNVDGETVESPSSNINGATGVCNDGTYTHAKHHQGACSHHGGVSYWF